MVKAVLFILLMFSVVSFVIIIHKYLYLRKAAAETRSFIDLYSSGAEASALVELSETHKCSPVSGVYRSLYADSLRLDRPDASISLRRNLSVETAKLESYLGFLATTGSTTPFIGLFGTVWGIMNAFRGMGSAGAASLAVVAPGIAEALIATAMGLAAAIPAVIAYNFYLEKTRRMATEMEDFSEELPHYLMREAQKRVARNEAP